jgi:catechol 2,3-dioxygenase-like lactoylglutathione lyase family enzyme
MSETVNVRYMVDDVAAAVEWYTTHLGFSLLSDHAPAFADVKRGPLRLLLSGPTSSAGRPMPDGERPHPGGGTASISSSRICRPKLPGCAPPALHSVTTSSPAPADRRSC